MDYFNQETDRLIFRKIITSDLESWKEFFTDNNSLRFLGIDLTKSINEHAESWLENQFIRYKENKFGQLAIIEKSSSKLIGMSGIVHREVEGKKYLEITYSLKQQFWGKGFGTETAVKFKEFGFENNISNEFISIIHKENVASINVALKNGMSLFLDTNYLGMEVGVYKVVK